MSFFTVCSLILVEKWRLVSSLYSIKLKMAQACRNMSFKNVVVFIQVITFLQLSRPFNIFINMLVHIISLPKKVHVLHFYFTFYWCNYKFSASLKFTLVQKTLKQPYRKKFRWGMLPSRADDVKRDPPSKAVNVSSMFICYQKHWDAVITVHFFGYIVMIVNSCKIKE